MDGNNSLGKVFEFGGLRINDVPLGQKPIVRLTLEADLLGGGVTVKGPIEAPFICVAILMEAIRAIQRDANEREIKRRTSDLVIPTLIPPKGM